MFRSLRFHPPGWSFLGEPGHRPCPLWSAGTAAPRLPAGGCSSPPTPRHHHRPLPPRQHLPRTPPGRPTAFPQARPAERVPPRAVSRRLGEGAVLHSPERGRADGPPTPEGGQRSPEGGQQSPKGGRRSPEGVGRPAPHCPPPVSPATPHSTNDTGRRQGGRGGARALRPSSARPSSSAPGVLPEVRRGGRRACARPVPIATRRPRVRGEGPPVCW